MTIPKILQKGLIATLFVGVVVAALSVPFIYESQTIWYKIGIDKTMLRAGKIAGLLAVVLIFVQIILAVRGKFLQDLFGVPALLLWHRVNGIIILVLVLSHVTLVLLPEGFANLPIGWKYWPEMIGAILLLIIISMVISSRFRQQLRFSYASWRSIHKPLGYLVLVMAVFHVLFVSESFEHIVPKTGLVSAVIMVITTVLGVKSSALRKKMR